MLFRFSNHRFHIIEPTLLNIFLFFLPIGLLMQWLINLSKGYINSHLVSFGFKEIRSVKKEEIFGIIFIQVVCICFHLALDYISHWDQFKIQMILQDFISNPLYCSIASRILVFIPVLALTLIGFLILLAKLKKTILLLIKHKQFLIDFSLTILITALIFSIRYFYVDSDSEYPIDVIIILLTGSYIQSIFLFLGVQSIIKLYDK